MGSDLLGTVSALSERILEDHPALADLMDRARDDFISEEEAMGAMLSFLSEHPSVGEALDALAKTELSPLQVLDAAAGDSPAELFDSRPSGLPSLNPLVEGALIERTQFDGDMPEMRTGRLPQGVRPSVSVQTDARNPVAVGKMLDRASDEVAEKVAAHEGERYQLIERVAEGDDSALAVIAKHGELVHTADGTPDVAALVKGSAATDHPEYRRGSLPVPQKVAKPTGAELAVMTPQERQQAAWGFLSTTQGRRSAINTIRHLVAENLRRRGLTIAEDIFDPKAEPETPAAIKEWSVGLGGEGATQPAFSIIDTAVAVLAASLFKQLPEGEYRLEVTTADRLADREVGWKARLL